MALSCCKPFTLTLGECPPPIFDATDNLTGASPISTQRPGCFSKSYPIHLQAGTFYTFRLTGTFFSDVLPGPRQFPACNGCDTYLYLLDTIGNVVAQNDDSAMQLSSGMIVLIEVEGDYIMECTTFSPGITGTIRTVVNSPCMSIEFAGNDSGAGTNIEYYLTAPQSVPPLTWDIVSGSLPPDVVIANDVFTPNLTFGKIFQGNDNTYAPRTFKVRVTDANGMQRICTVNWKCIGFQGYRIAPTFVLSPPIGSFYSFQMVPVGGVPPYIFSDITGGSLPGGLVFNPATGVISGVADGSNLPTSAGGLIMDSEGDYSGYGIVYVTCTGQHPISALTWTVTPTTPIPPGDFVMGSISGGDGSFDLQNIYPGFGPCVQNPTIVDLSTQLCNPTGPSYDVNIQVFFSGTLGNSPACPAIGDFQLQVTGLEFMTPISISGTGGQLYSGATNILTATVPTGGVVNVGISASVTYADCHLTVVFRPLTPP